MAIAVEAAAVILQADGVNKNFNFGFIIPYQADGSTPAVLVQLRSPLGVVTNVLPADYTIVNVGNPAGGSVTYPTVASGNPALAVGWSVIIARALAYLQPTAVNNTGFQPHTVEVNADMQEEQIQQVNRDAGAAVRLSLGEYAPALPAPNARKNALLYFLLADGMPALLTQTQASLLFQGSPGSNTAQPVGLFSAIGGMTIGVTVTAIWTSGFNAVGVGQGIYGKLVGYAGGANNYTKQSADGAWWQLIDAYPNALQFGCVNDGSIQDAAIDAAIAYSCAFGREIRFPGSPNGGGGYGVSIEHKLDLNGAAGFYGASLVGDGWQRSFIINYAATTTQKLFSMYGGSGKVTSKGIRGFTFVPATGANVGKGICVYIDGNDAARCDIMAQQPYRMYSVEDATSGDFSEYNRLHGWSINAADAAWYFNKGAGSFSFHGNAISGTADIGDGQKGISINGSGGTAFFYGIKFDVNLFGENFNTTVPTTAVGVFCDNAHCLSMEGMIECEGPLIFQATSSGQFDGAYGKGVHLRSISLITPSVAAGGLMRFASTSDDALVGTQGALASTQILGGAGNIQANTLQPLNLYDLSLGAPGNKANQDAPAFVGYINPATGDAGMIAVTFFSAGSGFMWSYVPFGAGVGSLVPAAFLRCDGTRLDFYPASGTKATLAAGPITGTTSGIDLDVNGRAGGALGRNPIQTFTGSGTRTLASTADGFTKNSGRIAIRYPNVGGIQAIWIAEFNWYTDGTGAPGYITSTQLVKSVNASGGAFTTPVMQNTPPNGPGGGDVTVDAAGNLKIAITSTGTYLIDYADIGTGVNAQTR